jgi:uncharacterized Zn-binding protein involved in type VI secretion
MAQIHRNTDSRICGASTVVVGQSTVFANSLLVAVNGDPNTHSGGNLIAACKNVFINQKMVVNHSPDNAEPDGLCPIPGGPHCAPATASGSPNVYVGD